MRDTESVGHTMASDNKGGYNKCFGFGPRDTNWRSYSKSLIVELKEKLADRRARTLAVLSEEEDLAAFNELDTESDGLEDTSTNITNNPCHDLQSPLPPEQSISETSSLTESDYKDLGSAHSGSRQLSCVSNFCVASRQCSESYSTVTSASCESVSSEETSYRNSGHEETDTDDHNAIDDKHSPAEIDVEQDISDITIQEPSLVGYTDFSEETVVDRDYIVHTSKKITREDHRYIKTEAVQTAEMRFFGPNSRTSPYFKVIDPTASKSETSLHEASDLTLDMHSPHTGILMESLHRMSQSRHRHDCKENWTISILLHRCQQLTGSKDVFDATPCECRSSLTEDPNADLRNNEATPAENGTFTNTQHDGGEDSIGEKEELSKVKDIWNYHDKGGLLVTKERQQGLTEETIVNEGTGGSNDAARDIGDKTKLDKYKIEEDYERQIEDDFFFEEDNEEECEDGEEYDDNRECDDEEEELEKLENNNQMTEEEEKTCSVEVEYAGGKTETVEDREIQDIQTESESNETAAAKPEEGKVISLQDVMGCKYETSDQPALAGQAGDSTMLKSSLDSVSASRHPDSGDSLPNLKGILDEVFRIFEGNMAFYDDIDKGILDTLESHFSKCGGILHIHGNISGNSGYSTNLKLSGGDELTETGSKRSNIPCERSERLQTCLNKARLASSLQAEISNMRAYPQTVAARAAYTKSIKDFEASMLDLLEENTTESSADDSANGSKSNRAFAPTVGKEKGDVPRSSNLVRSNTFLVTDRNSQKPPKCVRSERSGPFKLKAVPTTTVFGDNDSDNNDRAEIKRLTSSCSSGRDPHVSPTYIVTESENFQTDQKSSQQIAPHGISHEFQRVQGKIFDVDSGRDTDHPSGNNDFDSDSSDSLPDTRVTSTQKYTSTMLEKLLDYDSLEEEKNIHESVQSTTCKSYRLEQDGTCVKPLGKRKTWDETLRYLHHSPTEPWIQFQDEVVNDCSDKEDLGQSRKSPSEEKLEMEYNYESDFDTESDNEKNDNEEEDNDTKDTQSAGSINESPVGFKTCPAHRLEDHEIIIHTEENSQLVERDESAVINAVFSAQPAALSVPAVGENSTDGRTSPPDFPKQSPTGLESVENVGPNTNLLTSPLTKRQDGNAAGHSKNLTSPEKLPSSSRQGLSKDSAVSSKQNNVAKGSHRKWDTTKKGQKSRPGTFIPKIEWSSSDEDQMDDLHRDISPSDYLKQKQKEDVDGKLHQLHQFAKRKKKSKSPLRLRTPIKADDMDQFVTGQGSRNHSRDVQLSNENQGRPADNVDSVFKDLASSTPDNQLLDQTNLLADEDRVSEVFLSASELLQVRINSDREEPTSDITYTRTLPHIGSNKTDDAPAISLPKVVVNFYNPEVQSHHSDIEKYAGAQDSPAGTASSSSSTSGEYTLQNSSGKVCSKSESDLKPNTYKISRDSNTDSDRSDQTANKKRSDDSNKHSCVYDKFRNHSNLHTVEATNLDVANSIEHRVRHVKEEITSLTKTLYPDNYAALDNGQTSTVADLLQYALNSSPIDSCSSYDPPMLGGNPVSTQDVSISIPSPKLPVRGKNVNTPYTADMFQIFNTQAVSPVFPSASETPHTKQTQTSENTRASSLSDPKESRDILSSNTPGQSTLNVGLTDCTALHYSGDNYMAAQTVKWRPAKLQREPSYNNANQELVIHTECNNRTVCPDLVEMNSHDVYDNKEMIRGEHFQTERPPIGQCDSLLSRQTHAQDEPGRLNHNMLLALSYKVTQLEKMMGLVQNKISCNDSRWRLKYFAGEEIATPIGEDASNMRETQFDPRASTIPTTFSQVSSYGFGSCFCSLCQGHNKASAANCSLIPVLCRCCGEKLWHSGTSDPPSGQLETSLRHSKSTQTEHFHPPQNDRALTIDSCTQCSSETSQSTDFVSHFEGLVQLLTNAQHSIQSMKDCSETSRQAIHSLDERLSSVETEMSVKFDSQRAQLREMQVGLTDELRHSRNSLDSQSDLSSIIAQVTAAVDKATAVSQEAVKEQVAGVSCHLIKAVQDMVFPIQEAVSTLKTDVNDLTVSTERVRLAMEESKTTPTTKGMDHETMKMRIVELTSQRDAEKVFHKITRESLRALERDHDRLRQEFVRATCRQERKGERDIRSRVMYFLTDKDKEDYGNSGRHRSKRGDRNQSSTCFLTKLPCAHQSQSDDKHKLRSHSKTLKSCTCHKTDVSPSAVCRHRREAASAEPLYGPDSENSKQSAYSGGNESKTSSKCSEFSHRSATSGSGTPRDKNKEIKHYNLLDCSHKEHSSSTPQQEEDVGVRSQSLQGKSVDDHISHLRAHLLKDDTVSVPCSSSSKNYQETGNLAIEKSLMEQVETTPVCTGKLADIDNHGLNEELNLCKSCAKQNDPDIKQKALISESGTSVGLSDTDF